MLTEEQIRKEAERRYPNHYTEYDEGRAYGGFVRGASFALSQNQWISVEDRLPEENISVLWCKYPVEETYFVASMCDDDFDNYPDNYFTHWMPLPNPPQS